MKLKNKKGSNGFTLIEMVLVIAIIAIIATLAVPQVGKYMNKANRSKVVAAVSELNTTAISWSTENDGNLPIALTDIISEYDNLDKLGIGLKNDGTFKIGNIDGIIIYNNGEVYAKINSTSKAYPNEEIKVR